MKARAVFVCQACGHASAKWLGRCPECGSWNSFSEEWVAKERPVERPRGLGRAAGSWRGAKDGASPSGPTPIARVEPLAATRQATGSEELDRVLGGGFVRGSLVLVGGDPGIGKSTLLLQVARHVAETAGPVLYVTGEESLEQLRLRADRLGALAERLWVMSETDVEIIAATIEKERPELVIVDSIQTMHHPALQSAPGSVGQVRECTAELLRLAKTVATTIVLVGHITKAGSLAGPKVLEHAVDVVLYFEGDPHHNFRLLRGAKNRFGATDELGVFEMAEEGLVGVPDASELFLAERTGGVTGSVVVAALEGTRPVLVEVQALLSSTPFGTPRRTTTGVDAQRVALILAVLERRAGLLVNTQDAYVKVAGGMRIAEPAVDLGLAVAIASSFKERPVSPDTVLIGEVGLGGEVRAVQRVAERLQEAARLGFKRCILPRRSAARVTAPPGLELTPVGSLAEALEASLAGS